MSDLPLHASVRRSFGTGERAAAIQRRGALSPRAVRYYTGFFRFAGFWNCALTLGGLLLVTLRSGFFRYIGLADPAILLPYYALLPQVTLFGVGYYTLAYNLDRNHDIIRLGAVGKTIFFAAVVYYYANGSTNFWPLVVLTGDMVQVCMFIEFLVRVRGVRGLFRLQALED